MPVPFDILERRSTVQSNEERCRNCGAASSGPLCGPCQQDEMLEQAQLATAAGGRGMRCND
jgi:hypothetical protein